MQGSTGLGRCTAELGRSQRETAQRSLRELGENITSCELGNWNGMGRMRETVKKMWKLVEEKPQ